jgi:RNA polymerase sigma-70 factor (sigma-E family)
MGHFRSGHATVGTVASACIRVPIASEQGVCVADEPVDLNAFVLAHLRTLRRAAFLLCGNWADADDVTQDALVRLTTHIGRVRDPAAILAYARRCLFRAFLDTKRRSWRRETATEALPEASAAEEWSAVDARIDVLAALQGVPPRQRAALICRFFLDLDVADTAEVLRCREGTVKSQTARGLATLRANEQPTSQEAR